MTCYEICEICKTEMVYGTGNVMAEDGLSLRITFSDDESQIIKVE